RLAGTYGESFRAPSITDVSPNSAPSATRSTVFVTPLSGIVAGVVPYGFFPAFLGLGQSGQANYVLLLGGNPNLVPETSKNWTATARFTRGAFEAHATYFHTDYVNQIVFPNIIVPFLTQFLTPAGTLPNY